MMKKIRLRALLCMLACALLLCAAAPAGLAFTIGTATEAPELSQSEITAYLKEVVFDIEYGGESFKTTLRRWEQPIRIRVYGSPTDEDLATLDQHIRALNEVKGMPTVARVKTDANIEMYFVPVGSIHTYIDGYTKGNWGFYWVWWNDNRQITRAQIAIATDVTNQRQRNHLILEEFTQSLGIMQDSLSYKDSIFYSAWTETQQLSALDWALVRIVYDPALEAGMSLTDVLKALGNS